MKIFMAFLLKFISRHFGWDDFSRVSHDVFAGTFPLVEDHVYVYVEDC
jgi:hypothetical protein